MPKLSKLSDAQFKALNLMEQYPKSRMVWGFLGHVNVSGLPDRIGGMYEDKVILGTFEVRWQTFVALVDGGCLRRINEKDFAFGALVTGVYKLGAHGRRLLEAYKQQIAASNRSRTSTSRTAK